MTAKEKIQKFVDSQEGQSIVTLAVYTVRTTPTKVDDQALKQSDAIAEVISETLEKADDLQPTLKQAINAAIILIEKIAGKKSKIVQIILKLAKLFI